MFSISLALAVIAATGQSTDLPTAVLAGHVLDESGAPIRSAWVDASRWKDVAGKRRFTESHAVSTDADGYFLIADLTPGSYTVTASPEDDPRASGGVQAYQPTDSTLPFQLAAGSEMRDIRLVLRKQAAFGVSGTAVNAVTGEVIDDAWLILMPMASGRTGAHSARVRAGVFRFTNVLPGAYVIHANPNHLMRDEKTGGYRRVQQFGRMGVEVSGSDVRNLNVQLGSEGQLTGTFNMTTGDVVPPGAGLTLGPLEGVGPMLGARAADGTFRLSSVPPDRYRLHLTLPQNCYVISIRMAGAEIHNTVDLTKGGLSGMEILLSPTGAEISGRVKNSSADTAVVLWGPSGTQPQTIRASEDGSYTFRNLGPGEYHILALEDAHLIPPEDVDAWQALNTRAAAITVQEGAQLRLAPLTSAR